MANITAPTTTSKSSSQYSAAELRLTIGRFTGIVIHQDDRRPSMWRVCDHTGRRSDMANLTRAKDAALAWARPHGLGGTEVARWDRRESPTEHGRARLNGGAGL